MAAPAAAPSPAAPAALLPAGAAVALETAPARRLLQRVHDAARHGNYRGTLVSSADGQLTAARVWHFAVGGDSYEQVEALDGRQQRTSRHNEWVQTVWPQAGTAVVEKRELPAAWATTPQWLEPDLLAAYTVLREADGRSAGRAALVLLLQPRDAWRYAQRLWVDRATGLLLRADVLAPAAPAAPAAEAPGADRVVLESTAFSEVSIGVKPEPERVLRALKQTQGAAAGGLRVTRPPQQLTTLAAQGQALGRLPAGFRLVGCLLRGLTPPASGAGAGAAAGTDEPVLQSVFTDGLTRVSVFVEAFNAQRPRAEGQARRGATTTLTEHRGDAVLTAVGDVPPATLKGLIGAIERRRP